VAALTVKASIAWPLAVLAVIAIGILIGTATGLLRVIWGIPSFIVTLGLLTALQGIAFTISNGVTIAPTPDDLSPLWAGSLAGIATPIWVMIAVLAVGLWTLSQTRFGRRIYAVGGNLEAARRYGVRTSLIKVSVFVVVQLCAVLGGLLYTAQLGSGNATVGRFFELNVIASVVVGGVALFGGHGRLIGTALGVLFISVLANGLTLVGVSSYLFLIAQGLVVIAAVWFAAVQQRRATQRTRR
jgi:ribose/xylose/arabinose/galactoside ABC-type transport system permease subunit